MELRYSIGKVVKEIEKTNHEQLKVQPIPHIIIDKLYDVFQVELKRQNE